MIAAAVLSISEGGFGLETTARVEQGDPIRLRFQAQGMLPEIEVEAIVWYHAPVLRSRSKGEQRLLGCVLPDRAPDFLDLFAAVEKRNAPPERMTARPARTAGRRTPRAEEPDLPRSRDPLPPRKPEPEESLPRFRVRLRQIGGPRTRTLSVHACSIAQAADRARSELSDASGTAATGWAVLEVTPIADASGERRP